jgi:putative addiction module component (TIGR02574 family)
MTAFETVLDQALKLSDEEKRRLATRLLNSIDPADQELSSEDWDSAWSAELHKRVSEIREGTVELIDGDEVLAELHEIVERP